MSEQSKDGWQDIASAPKDGTPFIRERGNARTSFASHRARNPLDAAARRPHSSCKG
jgi:hypothetical protein